MFKLLSKPFIIFPLPQQRRTTHIVNINRPKNKSLAYISNAHKNNIRRKKRRFLEALSGPMSNHLRTTKMTTTPVTVVETINPIYEYSDEQNSATMQEMVQRQRHLWAACVDLDLIGRYTPNAWEFVLSPGHSLSWCNVFKAASSTWLYYFNILGE